ncbi:MAG: hypothetical protein KDK39_18810 [Leptospiraceae bacterium]|nr:hypothetical protein [Leptospiraceae bacterium]
MKRILFLTLAVLFLLAAVSTITLCSLGQALPDGRAGEKAEALADRIENAINKDAWDKTAAVSFVFSKRNNRHFRDKKRDLVEVEWGEDPVYKVQYSNQDRSKFLAWQGTDRLEGQDAADLLDQAVKYHTNDYFWLNPYSMLRAPGTVRKLVGEQALLLTFQSGGVTPGDSYLIITDENGLPRRWQMWVSIIPIDGIEWQCTEWVTSDTGAKLNLQNVGSLATIGLDQVRTWSAYPGKNEDRFAELLPLLEARE